MSGQQQQELQPGDSGAICAVLQPLFDIDGVRGLNGPAGYHLARLIHPRDASDLTVREVRALLHQVDAILNGGAA